LFVVLNFLDFRNIFENALLKVKCFCKNYREKLVYNTYKIRQTLKFAIEITKITIIIKQKLK